VRFAVRTLVDAIQAVDLEASSWTFFFHAKIFIYYFKTFFCNSKELKKSQMRKFHRSLSEAFD